VKLAQDLTIPNASYQSTAGRVKKSESTCTQEGRAFGSIKLEENQLSTQQSVYIPQTGFDLKSVILEKWKNVMISKPVSEYFCSVCNVDCGNIELFYEHRAKSLYICRVCMVTFANHQELETHFPNHKRYSCDVCKKVFYSRSDISHHKNTVKTCKLPTKKKLKCSLCSQKYIMKVDLKKHIFKEHINADNKACQICPGKTSFKTKKLYVNHMRAKHSAYENLECDFCGKLVVGPKKLINHKRYHMKKINIL
jgi:hypothetical protein